MTYSTERCSRCGSDEFTLERVDEWGTVADALVAFCARCGEAAGKFFDRDSGAATDASDDETAQSTPVTDGGVPDDTSPRDGYLFTTIDYVHPFVAPDADVVNIETWFTPSGLRISGRIEV